MLSQDKLSADSQGKNERRMTTNVSSENGTPANNKSGGGASQEYEYDNEDEDEEDKR
jgi:hypothetical protein